MPKIHIASPSGLQEELEESQLHARWREGAIEKHSLYWREGMANWQPIADFIASATPSTAAALPSAPAPQPVDPNAPFNPYAAPAYQPEPEAPAAYVSTGPIRPVFYKHPRLLTNVLTMFLALCVVAYLLLIINQISQYLLVSRPYTMEEGVANDARLKSVFQLTQLAFFSTAIVFGMWIYRAAMNSRSFGARGMQDTPGWSVGWYFIPIMHLFRPYQAMKQIWQVSANPDDWENQPGSPVLTSWWTFWVLANLVGNIANVISRGAETTAGLQVATLAALASCICSLAVSVAAIILVRTLLQRQEALVARSAA
jgi:hypothetical protein